MKAPFTPGDPKEELRERMKRLRDQVTPGMAEAASQSLCKILPTLPEFRSAKGIGAFASRAGEIDSFPLLEGILGLGKKLHLPKVAADKSHFSFFPVHRLEDLRAGAFGIPEPTGTAPTPWDHLDLVLVPGLAFDRSGNRLGYGGGFYDKALPRLKPSAMTLGLGYSFQVVEGVPASPHDHPVKALLTEKGLVRCPDR